MSELIMLINRETGTRRFQMTPEDTTPKREPRGCPAPPVSLRIIMSVLHRLLGCIYAVLLASLIKGLTIDAPAYIYQPLPPSLFRS